MASTPRTLESFWDNYNNYSPRLLPFRRRPAVGFGPKLEEMNPRTFPDLPICPRTLDFDQKTYKTAPKKSNEKFEKFEKSLIIALYCPIIIIPAFGMVLGRVGDSFGKDLKGLGGSPLMGFLHYVEPLKGSVATCRCTLRIRPSVRPTVRPSDRPSDHASVSSTVRPSDRPSVRPSDRPSVRPFDCPKFFKLFNLLKSSFDALDSLYGPE